MTSRWTWHGEALTSMKELTKDSANSAAMADGDGTLTVVRLFLKIRRCQLVDREMPSRLIL